MVVFANSCFTMHSFLTHLLQSISIIFQIAPIFHFYVQFTFFFVVLCVGYKFYFTQRSYQFSLSRGQCFFWASFSSVCKYGRSYRVDLDFQIVVDTSLVRALKQVCFQRFWRETWEGAFPKCQLQIWKQEKQESPKSKRILVLRKYFTFQNWIQQYHLQGFWTISPIYQCNGFLLPFSVNEILSTFNGDTLCQKLTNTKNYKY